MATWTGVGRYTTGLARALAARRGRRAHPGHGRRRSASGRRRTHADRSRDLPVPSRPASKHPFSLGGARELSRIARERGAGRHPLPALPDADAGAASARGHHARPDAAGRARHHALGGQARRLPLVEPSRGARRRPHHHRRHLHRRRDRARLSRAPPGASPPSRSASTTSPPVPSGPLPEPLRSIAGTPYLLSMGSTRGHKDLPTLLSAFAAIAPDRPELRLLLVGAEEPGYLARVLADAPRRVRERVALHRPCRRRGAARAHGRRGGVRVPVALRGIRPAAARGDGAGHARRGRRRGVAARGRRRRRADLRAGRLRTRSRPRSSRCSTTPTCASACSAAGLARASELTWARTAAATVDVYRAGCRPALSSPRCERRGAGSPARASAGESRARVSCVMRAFTSTLGCSDLLKKISDFLNDFLRINAIRRMLTIVDVKKSEIVGLVAFAVAFAIFEGIGLSLLLPILQYAEGARVRASGRGWPDGDPAELGPLLAGARLDAGIPSPPADAAGPARCSRSSRSCCARSSSTSTPGTRRSSRVASVCG